MWAKIRNKWVAAKRKRKLKRAQAQEKAAQKAVDALLQPKAAELVPVDLREAPRLVCGVAERQGLRQTMEDRSLAITDLGAPGFSGRALSPQALVAVMDGHGGPGAAEWLRDNLAAEVRAHLARVAQEVTRTKNQGARDEIISAALSAAFATADQKLLLEAQVTSSGSCLTGALVIGARLYMFNVGDSRTLLCRAGALQLATRDHKPDLPAEWDRISEAGGIVLHGRVMGELAVSRAFGDFHLKDPLRLPPEHPRRSPAPLAGGYPQGLTDRWALLQKEAAEGMGAAAAAAAAPETEEEEEPLWQSPLVIPTPEITVAALTDQDEFILLACDGLFDVTTNEEAVEAACSSLRTEGGNDFVAHACETLATSALSNGSQDNVTVMLVLIQPQLQRSLSRMSRASRRLLSAASNNSPLDTFGGSSNDLSAIAEGDGGGGGSSAQELPLPTSNFNSDVQRVGDENFNSDAGGGGSGAALLPADFDSGAGAHGGGLGGSFNFHSNGLASNGSTFNSGSAFNSGVFNSFGKQLGALPPPPPMEAAPMAGDGILGGVEPLPQCAA